MMNVLVACVGTAPSVCRQYQEATGYCAESQAPGSHLWPKPVSLTSTSHGKTLVLSNDTFRIASQGGGDALRQAIDRYQQLIFAPVADAAPTGSRSSPITLKVLVRDNESALLSTEQDESYTLSMDASGHGTLNANSTVGAMRGLETFAQLVEYSDNGEVQLMELPINVIDRPRWKYRGLKVDTSRHFISIARLHAVIRGMEASKLNVLQWHVVDGPSFPLESLKFPQLSAKGKFCSSCVYTQQDVRELIEFARARGVRVIPELDIPGHSGFQFGMPELVACPAFEAGNGGSRALDPTLDGTYAFLIEWLSEMGELFGDPLINVYGDEVRFECWNQSANVLRFMQARGIAEGDFQAVTEVFWRRFAAEVAPAVFNRTGVAVMIGEADVWGTDGPPFALPEWLRAAAPDYPLPLTVEVWGGHTLVQNENGTLRKTLSTPGMQAVVGGAYYLDQTLPRPFGDPPGGKAGPLVYPAPYWVSVWRTMYAFDPLGDPALTAEQKARVIGLLAEMWGEQVNGGTIEQRIFPHALAVAERSWTSADHFDPQPRVWDSAFYAEVEGRLNAMSCTLNRRGVQSSPSAPGHCSWSQLAY